MYQGKLRLLPVMYTITLPPLPPVPSPSTHHCSFIVGLQCTPAYHEKCNNRKQCGTISFDCPLIGWVGCPTYFGSLSSPLRTLGMPLRGGACL